MSETDEPKKSSAMDSSSLQIDAYPRDLLRRFNSASTEAATGSTNTTTSSSSGLTYKTPNEKTEELELTLGLSLGGQFGVDKSVKGLMRSSSIAGLIPFTREDDTGAPPAVSIIRTSSLPTETEEERRKRKEIQTLRRIEAKRRLTEKQRSFKGGGEEERQIGLVLRERERVERSRNAVEGKVAQPFGLPGWAAAARQGCIGGGGSGSGSGGGGGGSDGDGNRKFGFLGQQTSQGSVEQRGGSSSGESNNNPLQGLSFGEGRRASSDQPQPERANQEAAAGPSEKGPSRTSSLDLESPSKKPDRGEKRGKDIDINTSDDMPWVFTKGNGPNGRRVDGVLYKYGKGEEVRIMCVCHGSFHSPAEFVRHAGGTDVTNPLRHIVVNRNPASFS